MAQAQSDFAAARRAPVVVMFVETRGFTRTSEILEPAVVLARLAEFFALVAGAIQRQGGKVIDALNDTMVACFAGDSDADRAVQAATEIQRDFADLEEAWQRDYGIRAAVAMGLHRGAAVAGYAGGAGAGRLLLIGDAVSVCERLLHRARAGEFVMSDKIVERLHPDGGPLSAEDLPPLEIPRRDPIPLFGVLLDTRLDFT